MSATGKRKAPKAPKAPVAKRARKVTMTLPVNPPPVVAPTRKKAPVGLPPGLASVTQGKSTRVERPQELEEQPWDKHPSAAEEEDLLDAMEAEDEEGSEDDGHAINLTDEERSEDSDGESEGSFIDDSESDEDSDSEPGEDDPPPKHMKFPSSTFFQGVKYAGKTELMKYLHSEVGHNFDATFVVTQTPEKIGCIATGPEYVLPRLTEEFLNDLREYMTKKPTRVLLVCDDFVGIDFPFHKSPAWKSWVTNIRNKEGSIWMGCQTFKEMTPSFRDNADYVFIGNNPERQIEQVSEEVGTVSFPRKKLRRVLGKIAKQNRDDFKQFVFMDKRNQFHTVWAPPMLKPPKTKGRKKGKARRAVLSDDTDSE